MSWNTYCYPLGDILNILNYWKLYSLDFLWKQNAALKNNIPTGTNSKLMSCWADPFFKITSVWSDDSISSTLYEDENENAMLNLLICSSFYGGIISHLKCKISVQKHLNGYENVSNLLQKVIMLRETFLCLQCFYACVWLHKQTN